MRMCRVTLQRVETLAGRIRPRAAEALVLAFATASVVEVSVSDSVHHRVAVAAVALGWSLPFIARRRYPFLVPLVVAAALVALAFLDGDSTMDLATPFFGALLAAASFGQLRNRTHSFAGLTAMVVAAAVVDFEAGTFSDFIWTSVVIALAWAVGSVLGARAEQARVLRARVAASERERLRITRELHDLVAHSISSMVVQTSAVRRLLTEEQAREREALTTVEQTGRDALAEMRRMVGVMRAAEAHEPMLTPQPGLKHLDALIAQVESEGLPVTLRVEGDRPELSPGLDLSAYRVVQDALAGALEHANGSGARVVVRYGPTELELEITDGGAIAKQLPDVSSLRERLALYGGTLDAQPRQGGGVVIRATLPVGTA
jgi:signal transduction histidine kinase